MDQEDVGLGDGAVEDEIVHQPATRADDGELDLRPVEDLRPLADGRVAHDAVGADARPGTDG